MSAARRREKAVKRGGEWLHDLDVRWAFRNDRLPLYAEAISVCSCGRRSWLMPGASVEEQGDFDASNDEHAYWHDMDADAAEFEAEFADP